MEHYLQQLDKINQYLDFTDVNAFPIWRFVGSIPSTDVDFVETSGLSTGDYKSIAKVRVTKVKLVEQVHKEVLLVDSNYVLRQNTNNKVVVEYEVTNADEVKQHLGEDEQRDQKKAQTKEQLQQFITPKPKGE